MQLKLIEVDTLWSAMANVYKERESVLNLIQEKDRIENEIKNLTAVLTKNGIGMTDPLVDAEGFPLSHIDVYQIRHARQKIICLQNDHKNIMKQIEVGLCEYYSTSKVENFNTINKHNTSSVKPLQQYKDPFAKVVIVTEGSPASYAGLKAGDLIVEFGSINVTNFTNIMDIGNVVKHSEGCQLNVKLKRNEDYIVTYILPKRWIGPGLLGCNIVGLH